MSIRRGRLRSTIKWGGAVVTVLLLIVWVGSGWYAAYTTLVPSLAVQADAGRFHVIWMSNPPVMAQSDLYVRHAAPGALFRWWFTFKSMVMFGDRVAIVAIPGWVVIAMFAAPTFFMWRNDHKRDPNACRNCGYSRTGLPVDRACPECGYAASRGAP